MTRAKRKKVVEKTEDREQEELTIGSDKENTPNEVPIIEPEPSEVPDPASDFMALMIKYGVKPDAAGIITSHITDTGSAEVFQKPSELLSIMVKFSRQLPAVTRRNILDHWISWNKLTVPEDYDEIALLPPEKFKTPEQRTKEREEEKERAKAKFGVDSATGNIRQAIGDEIPLTYTEAERISDRIKAELNKANKGRGSDSGEDGKFAVDPETGTIRAALENEIALTMQEAERVSDRIRAERGQYTKRDNDDDVPFTLNPDGSIRIEPGAKLGGRDLLALQAATRSQDVVGKDSDPTDQLLKMREVGLIPDWRDKPGESETDKLLRLQIEDMRKEREELLRRLDEKEKQELKGQISALASRLEELRAALANGSRADNEYDIMREGISAVKELASGLRSDIKEAVVTIGSAGKNLPPMSKAEQAMVTRGIAQRTAAESEAVKLGSNLFKAQG